MSLSSLIEEFIDLKIKGEPQSSDWRAITDCAEDRRRWHNRLAELRKEIDATLIEEIEWWSRS